ncbi:uncharacterized protein [Diadema antillarum]|uniref:uncharacterized protein n=1 Tax=Diadema antillarum TaxID=105358 RepID=UPI003A89BC88
MSPSAGDSVETSVNKVSTTATTGPMTTKPTSDQSSVITPSTSSEKMESISTTSSTLTSTMVTRRATIKNESSTPDIKVQPEASQTGSQQSSTMPKTGVSPAIITRHAAREPSVSTPTMKTRTSSAAAAAATSSNAASVGSSNATMKTRQASNRVSTPKSSGTTTSLTVGGRAMSCGSPLTPQSSQDALVKRRSSSRSIKRKKFDDELVESSLVKSSRGKLPPSGMTLSPSMPPSQQQYHHSPPPPPPPPPPPAQPSPPPPPVPQIIEKAVVKIEEKKIPEPPKPVIPPPPPPPPPKKPEVVKTKPKAEPPPPSPPPPTPTPPAPPPPKQQKVETPRPAPEKKKGKALPSKSSSSKSSRSKKSKSLVPLARETSRWTAEDDLALITAVHQTNDLEQVFQGVKFSHRFSMKEIEERWYALLYDPIASKASQTAMRLLHPDIKIAIMSQALYSEDEEKILGSVTSTSQPTVDTFQELLNKNASTFNPMRTPKGLQTHWTIMKQYHLLPDQTVQPMPRGDHVLNFSDAEDMMDDSQLQDPRDEILEHELAAFDRRQKRQIRHLENEIPKWQVLVENVTGMTSQEFDSQTLAVLRGRLVRYLMRSKEITIGRASQDNTIDVDLSLEGPAWKVSRKQGVIKLRNNGEFYLANEGKRAVHIDGKPVLKGQKWKLANNSVVEIAGLRFIFLVNQDVISTLRTETPTVK